MRMALPKIRLLAADLSPIPVNESSREGERSNSGKGKEKGIAYS
jgi:hypothetical protein